MSLSTGLQKVMGSGMVTHSSTLALQTLRVSPHTWETLVEKRKLRMPRPSFLRELQSRKERESLYVVTEAMETLQDTTLQSLSKVEGAGQLSFLGPSHFKGQCQSHVAKEKTVIVPRGSVLAYRVLQLVIKEDHWGKQRPGPHTPWAPPALGQHAGRAGRGPGATPRVVQEEGKKGCFFVGLSSKPAMVRGPGPHYSST
nr:gasdermin-A-like [Loxodonta africana]